MFHALSFEPCALAPEGSHTAFAVSASKASIPSRAYFLPTPFIALIFKPHFCGVLFILENGPAHFYLRKTVSSLFSLLLCFYFTTIFIIFPGTTISLIIVLPSIAALIFSSALAIPRIASLSASLGAITVERTLPFI